MEGGLKKENPHTIETISESRSKHRGRVYVVHFYGPFKMNRSKQGVMLKDSDMIKCHE